MKYTNFKEKGKVGGFNSGFEFCLLILFNTSKHGRRANINSINHGMSKYNYEETIPFCS